MTATTQDTYLAARLSLKIGATEEAVARLVHDLAEDEAVLALFHRGTPPPAAGWRDEDECAAFVAESQRKVTEMQAELEWLREDLEALRAEAGDSDG